MNNNFTEEVGRFASNAADSLFQFKKEFEAMISAQLENMIHNMDLVTKDEYEVLKASLQKTQEELEQIKKHLDIDSKTATQNSDNISDGTNN